MTFLQQFTSSIRQNLIGKSRHQGYAALVSQADEAMRSRAWEQAAALYAEFLQDKPERAELHVQHGHALKEQGRLAEAETAYRRAMVADPIDWDAFLHLGHMLLRLQEHLAALASFVAAAERGSTEAQTIAADLQVRFASEWIRPRRAQINLPDVVSLGHVGQVFALKGRRLSGWALDVTDPTRPVTVRLVDENGEKIAEIATRPDVTARSLLEVGEWQIELPADRPLRSGQRLSIIAGDGYALPGGPLTVEMASGALEAIQRETAADTTQPIVRIKLERIKDGIAQGWAVVIGDPDAEIELDVSINDVFYRTVRNDRRRLDLKSARLSNGGGGFSFELPQIGRALDPFHEAEDVKIVVHTTNALQSVAITHKLQKVAAAPFPLMRPNAISIIIPVYNAASFLQECLESIFRHTTVPARLILIDDASPDADIPPLLAEAEKRPHVTVLRNDENLGFSGAINRGIEAAGSDDVVLLNSDTRVTPGWLDGLRRCAYSDAAIGAVSPFSDNAGAFSAPSMGRLNPLPVGVSEDDFSVLVRRTARPIYPSVPTAHGFCMYVRRACLDDVGLLDAAAFPRGYGEENDFCMRAGARGWRHVIDDGTYVFHERAKSFGDHRTDLMAAGRSIVDQRYPDYKKAIAVFGARRDIMSARFNVGLALHHAQTGVSTLPRVLYVVSTQTGGTPQTNADLMRSLRDVYETWVLHCDSTTLTLSLFHNGSTTVIERSTLDEAVVATSHHSFDYDRVVAAWLAQYGFAIVHIRHLAWHSLSLPRLAQEAGAAVVLSFHDYYTVCPTVKLLDADRRFCDGDCARSNASEDCAPELWAADALPPLKGRWIQQWRDKFAAAFRHCDMFVTTSPFARERIMRAFPGLPAERFVVVPHGRDAPKTDPLPPNLPVLGEPIRILVPGNISVAKGRDVVLELLALDADRRLEFHILGDHQFEGPQPGLVLHGRYARDRFIARVREIRPHAGAIFSVWDETYCHTLTELWQAGLPAMVFDFGNVAARVRASGAGWVHPHDDLQVVYDRMLADLTDVAGFFAAAGAATRWTRLEGGYRTTAEMGSRYIDVYRAAARRRRTFASPATDTPSRLLVAVLCPPGAASSAIRIGERTRNAHDRDITYLPVTPDQLVYGVESGEIACAILQRTALPAAAVARLEPHVARGAFRFLYDIDDDLLDVPAEKDPSGAYAAARRRVAWQLKHAALVTVSTPFLAERLAPHAGRIEVLPNRLSPRLWRRWVPFARLDDGLVRALYMGTPTHDGDLAAVTPALEAVAAARPDFRLVVVGGWNEPPADLPPWVVRRDPPKGGRGYDAFVPWLMQQTRDIDFAIAPLAATPFNAAKSGLKFLDYAGLGLSGVFADTPCYRDEIAAAGFGRAVPMESDAWRAALTAAIEGVDQLHDEGMRARIWAVERRFVALDDFDAMVQEALANAAAAGEAAHDLTADAAE